MAVNILPSQDTLNQLLRYDPQTGLLYWRVRGPEWSIDGFHSAATQAQRWNKRWANKEALTSVVSGYRKGSILFKEYLAHRVIWKMFNGTEPDQIDHINGVRSDNRLENLRSVAEVENHKNQRMHSHNTSGVCGVSWEKARSTWAAHISKDNRKVHLGYFKIFEEAVAARKAAELQYGFHENHGKAA